jgi:pimeloyl-ACP methyl ester carboxylesterase
VDADILRIPVGPGLLHVERYGFGGPPVVLLHGFPTSSFLWRAVGAELAIAGRTAFAIDMLGYGESDRPFDADYGIGAQADYVDRALTALRVARTTVVGVDLGAGVALRLAATRPDRVDRLVLVNPIAFDAVPAGDVAALQRSTARFALRAARGILGAAALLTPVLEASVARGEHMPARLVARYLAPFVGPDGIGHLLALSRAIRGEDLEDIDYTQIASPALVVRGDADEFTEPEIAERLVAAIPGSRLVRLPGTGRLVPEEDPDQLVDAILEFAGAADAI